MTRPETAHRAVDTVVAGYFRQGVDYSNWRPRGSGDWLLLFTVEGTGLITFGDQALRLGPGEALLYAPGQAQDYCTDPDVGRWHLRWAHFQPRPPWRAWLHWPPFADGPGHLRVDAPEMREAVSRALARLIDTARRDWGETSELCMNALEEALLWLNLSARSDARWKLDPRVRIAMDYLAAHLNQPFHLGQLATQCGLSPSRLAHLFKDATGLSLQRYSEELRLREAQRLLTHTSLPLKAIATETGFADPYYFSKRFHRFAGQPPSVWRSTRGVRG